MSVLRLAFARPSRAVLSSLVAPSRTAWIRYNSTGPSVPPAASNVASTSKRHELKDTELLDQIESLTASLEPEITKVEFDVAETEGDLSGEKIPEQSQDESSDDIALRLTDPKRLPLTEPLGEKCTEEQYAATLVHGRGFHAAYHHPRAYDIPAANIQFRSHRRELLELFTHFATHAASSLGIPVSGVISLPTQRTLWTVLRSPHVHKKSQENFERRVHKRAIKAWDADPEVVDRWCEYLRRHALAGVGMRVTKWKRVPLGVGSVQLAEVEERLAGAGERDAARIKSLGERIVAEESVV